MGVLKPLEEAIQVGRHGDVETGEHEDSLSKDEQMVEFGELIKDSDNESQYKYKVHNDLANRCKVVLGNQGIIIHLIKLRLLKVNLGVIRLKGHF